MARDAKVTCNVTLFSNQNKIDKSLFSQDLFKSFLHQSNICCWKCLTNILSVFCFGKKKFIPSGEILSFIVYRLNQPFFANQFKKPFCTSLILDLSNRFHNHLNTNFFLFGFNWKMYLYWHLLHLA